MIRSYDTHNMFMRYDTHNMQNIDNGEWLWWSHDQIRNDRQCWIAYNRECHTMEIGKQWGLPPDRWGMKDNRDKSQMETIEKVELLLWSHDNGES